MTQCFKCQEYFHIHIALKTVNILGVIPITTHFVFTLVTVQAIEKK